MSKAYRPVPAEDVFAGMSVRERAEVKARAVELIAEEYALRDLRKAKRITQEQVARRLGGRQVYVSRLENRADMKLSTLRDYVRAIGGDLRLMVTFPEGRTVGLKAIGADAKRPRRKVAKARRVASGARRKA
jgi:transcriptional regulator with XRE-family HTH domain